MKMPRVVVHFDAKGNVAYYADGNPVELLIVDDRAPDDRVYRYGSHQVNSCVIDALIGDDHIFSLGDKPGMEAAIRAALDGKPPPRPFLTVIASNNQQHGEGK